MARETRGVSAGVSKIVADGVEGITFTVFSAFC